MILRGHAFVGLGVSRGRLFVSAIWARMQLILRRTDWISPALGLMAWPGPVHVLLRGRVLALASM